MTDRLSTEHMLQTLRAAWELCPIYSLWRHRVKGDVYVVRDNSFREHDMIVTVTYHPVGEPNVRFNRALVEFIERFELLEGTR